MGNSAGNQNRQNQNKPTARNAQNAQGQEFSTFSMKQRQALLKRYRSYDPSPNSTKGIPLDVCLAMPEFVGNKLLTVLIHDFINEQTGCLHQQEFLTFCTFLSPNTTIAEKKKALFDSFDVYGTGILTHDEIFRLYKVLLGHVISDDHILALAFTALKHPALKEKGRITREEFSRMVPDSEVDEKLTVQFNIPTG